MRKRFGFAGLFFISLRIQKEHTPRTVTEIVLQRKVRV